MRPRARGGRLPTCSRRGVERQSANDGEAVAAAADAVAVDVGAVFPHQEAGRVHVGALTAGGQQQVEELAPLAHPCGTRPSFFPPVAAGERVGGAGGEPPLTWDGVQQHLQQRDAVSIAGRHYRRVPLRRLGRHPDFRFAQEVTDARGVAVPARRPQNVVLKTHAGISTAAAAAFCSALARVSAKNPVGGRRSS